MSQRATMWPSLNGTPSSWSQRIRAWQVAAGVVAVVAVVVLTRLISPPRTVDHVTLVNPTAYDLSVDVTDGNHGGWLGLGTIGRQSTASITEVVDQGGTWIFRFAGQGLDAGQMQLSRNDLKRSGWQVDIPRSAGSSLLARGAPPPP